MGNGNSSDWLSWALSTPAEAHRLVVDGVSVAYRAWGDVGPRGIVLVHGGKANGHWWDHIAPFLTRWGRVLSVDLSGHGDSDRRPGYSLELWADEVLAAAEHGGITGPPVLIGHSTGGFVVLSAAVSQGSHLAGAIVIDSPVQVLSAAELADRERSSRAALRIYATPEAAVSRFGEARARASTRPELVEHVARNSLAQVAGGWSWSYDPRTFTVQMLDPRSLSRPGCRISILRAGEGLLTEAMAAAMLNRLGDSAVVVDVPTARHYVMLDEPLLVVVALRSVLSEWRI